MDGVTIQVPTMPIKDAAEFLGVSIDTIRRRLRRGELTGEFTDGRWLISVPDNVEAGPNAASQLALRLIEEEVRSLRAERDRLLAVIEALVAKDPERRSLIERLMPPRP